LPSHDETAPERLIDGLDEKFRRDDPFGDHVNESPQGRRDTDAVDGLDVFSAQPGVAEAKYGGDRGHPPESGRYRHVKFRRHHVRQFMQCQRSRVTKNALGFVPSIPRPQLPHDEVGPRRRGKLRQAVDTALFADPVSGAHLIRVDAIVVSGLPCLAGGKKAALSLDGLVELAGRGGITRHAIKPKMISGNIAYFAITLSNRRANETVDPSRPHPNSETA
jgi:hypothetical protein